MWTWWINKDLPNTKANFICNKIIWPNSYCDFDIQIVLATPRTIVIMADVTGSTFADESYDYHVVSYAHCWQGLRNSGTRGNYVIPRQNGRHFAEDIFTCIFVNDKFCTLITISLTLVPRGPIYWGPPYLNLVVCCIFHLLTPLLCKTWF